MVVADGMGGHKAGAEASQLAIETIGEVFTGTTLPPDEMLCLALETANHRIYSLSREDPELRGMGTTAVAMLFCPDQTAWVAHVGDSRAYRYRDAQLEPITRDHSVVAELERRGHLTPEEAAVHPRRNEILRSVGVQASVEVEVAQVDLQIDDRYVICSDGLSGMVTDPDIAAVVDAYPIADAANLLIQMANDAGGQDNVTVQIARFALPDAPPEPAPPLPDDRPTPSPGTHGPSRQHTAMVVGAVLVAGFAALTILWRIYNVSQAPLPPEPSVLEETAAPSR
jgi:serine/threonine protein phosphatase PrpC